MFISFFIRKNMQFIHKTCTKINYAIWHYKKLFENLIAKMSTALSKIHWWLYVVTTLNYIRTQLFRIYYYDNM